MRASRIGAARLGSSALVTALVAAVIFWIAYDNGGYGLESRASIAIAVWWTLIVVVVFGLVPREPLQRASLVIGGLLAALALWTLASLLWTASAEKMFDEFSRVSLYLGVFALVTVASSRRTIGRWADGLALAIAGVAVVALASRLFPGVFPERDLATFLPGAVTRLSFPLGYWNGLAIFLALGVPLLLRVAVIGRGSVVRGLALAPMPVIAAAIYLASSRGGVVTALVAAAVFVALTERRWTAGVALAVSLLGSAAAVGVLLDRDELVNGPLGTDLVERQGQSAALVIAVACVGVTVAYGVGSRLLMGRLRSPSPAIGWAVVGAVAIGAAVGAVLADPVERFRVFKAPPAAIEPGDFVTAHLLSGGGSGRWQLWSSTLDEFRDSAPAGDGGGAFEAWWAEHGSITLFAKDAHSLYLETLGELGLVGLGLVLALVLVGLVVGVRRALEAEGDQRVTVAALGAVFAGYAAAAGFDWVWELTAVSLVAVSALALLSGFAAARPAPLAAVEVGARLGRTRSRRFGVGIATIAVVWVLILGQAIPLLAQRQIADSQAAVNRDALGDALDAAAAARDIQPWAATPYLQLALVSEQLGALATAHAWIREAIERDARDWRLWLVSARVETKMGRARAAERSLRHAIQLNPRSPLFNELLDEDSRP